MRHLLISGTRWCLVWGVAALGLRFLGFSVRACVIGGATGAAVIAAVSLARAIRRAPDRAQVAAFIDARFSCGGLLAASTSVPLGDWTPQSATAGWPRVQWKFGRRLLVLAAALLFAVSAVLIPIRSADAAGRLHVSEDVERLATRIELLEQEKIVDAERADTFRRSLESLERNSAGDDPAKAWQTLDAIDDATTKLAEDAGEESIRQGEALGRVEAAASAMEASGLGDAELSHAMAELAAEASRAGGADGELLEGLSEDTKAAIAKSAISSDQLKEIAAAARAGKGALRKTLAKLGRGGVIDPSVLRRFDDAANAIDKDALARFLREHSKRSLAEGFGSCGGRGGVDRGRGDAPMYFGEASADEGRFEDQILPPAAAAALADSDLVAVSAAAPDAQPTPSETSSGATMKPGHATAVTNAVVPRHRGTVTRYFRKDAP